jgi:hypothetical protein
VIQSKAMTVLIGGRRGQRSSKEGHSSGARRRKDAAAVLIGERSRLLHPWRPERTSLEALFGTAVFTCFVGSKTCLVLIHL